MNEQFEQWWQVFDATPRQSILGLKTAAWEGWKGHEESMKIRFACHSEGPCLYKCDAKCVLKDPTDCVNWGPIGKGARLK